jgi:hypothetical protein
MTVKEEDNLKYTDLKYGRGFFTGRSTMSTDSLGGGGSLSSEGNIKKGNTYLHICTCLYVYTYIYVPTSMKAIITEELI